jgi:glycosyltransferase involved in cell wall biosynthesis
MNYRRHPEDMTALERFVYSVMIPQAARRSQRVLTLTNAARSDIVRWTRAPATSIDVIHAAPREAWPGDPTMDETRVRSTGIVDPFILGVAASYPHKNTLRLVEAFPITTKEGARVGLVMTGHPGRAQRKVEAAALAKRDTVRLLGWVDDALLGSLYRRAVGLAFPSLYEGFGLPLVEAMALGTPVLTSNFGAMLEVANGAAEFVDPYDISSIKRGLQRLVDSPERRDELRELGRRRASQFSWDTTARQTLAAYAAVAQSMDRR